ncbi:multidrug and toxin extrusion protein 1-like [Anneissia japonica]|uniref:multidrug and toxin extrusion protein 1-like n=1 Tax=Anneissia japonica TaxID=1529436 RepID=UPI00142559D9|nr:multidrug and toxin extrusion protein 1-like [Anneissia japonica]
MTSSSQNSIGNRCCKSSTNCCKNLQNISLQDLKAELKKQFKYTWPSILYNFCNYFLVLTTLLFCGRLGKLEFAAASLASSVINSLCLSVARGSATACDTFFAQMYGSDNRKKIGVVLQRSLIILTIFALPVLATFPNMERILIAVNVKPDIARLTGTFVVYFMPAVPVVFCIEVFVKYLQNTNHVLPVVVCTVTANAIGALLCYIFIFRINMGISGPALSLVLTYFALLILLVGYIKFSKMYVETWQGFSKECFYDWGSFISLSISGMMHICLEWWGFEIGYFLSGILGKTELGAYSITVQFAALSYMIPLGLAIAASIRIGHSLGAKDSKSARTALCVALLCSWVCALFVCILWLSTKDHLAKVFIDDPEIISLVSKVVPLCVVYSFFDFTGAVCNGGLRGAGHQKIGAIVGFISYYIICLPVGGYLMFKTDLGIIGLWSGITLGLMAQGSSLLIYMMKLDWDLEGHKVSSFVPLLLFVLCFQNRLKMCNNPFEMKFGSYFFNM